MFRITSIIGLGGILLILAATAVLFSFRLVSTEDGNFTTVLIAVAGCLVGVAGCMLYVARRREREDYESARKAADLDRPHGAAANRS
jgi:membrane-bound ClpP family serine protease